MMVKNIFIILIIPILFFNCSGVNKKEGISDTTGIDSNKSFHNEFKKIINNSDTLVGNFKSKIFDYNASLSYSIVRYKNLEIKFPDSSLIYIYNKDESIYSEISFYKGYITFDNQKFLFHGNYNQLELAIKKHKFFPRDFYPEYNILIFECVGEKNNMYKVVIDSVGTIKYVKKNDPLLIHETIEQHLFKAFLGFDSKNNPLKKSPDEKSDKIAVNEPVGFVALEVKGDWVKIKCPIDGCSECGTNDIGWIRWKEGNKILVKFYYAC